MAGCTTIYGNDAAYLVGVAQDHFFQLGARTYNSAVSALNNLAGTDTLLPIPPQAAFDFSGVLQPFQRPPRPALDTSGMDFAAPPPPAGAPDLATGGDLALDPQPAISAAPPILAMPQKPATPNIAAPTPPAVNFNLLLPQEPNEPLPPLPQFDELNLPSVPNIQFAEVTSTLPTFVDPPFDDDWGFEPEAYASELKDKLFAALDPMLQSRPALPEHIEAAIFQKGRNRIEIETQRAVEQAVSEFGGRGFDVPNGIINGGVIELRQGGQDKIAQFALDAAVKQYEETLANLRFAITNGAALEGTYINLHVEMQRFALEAARNQREGAVAVLNYRVQVFNTRMEGYKAEAQVVETRIRAELGKIEVFRAQIEAERAKGEINESKVRLYSEQVKAVGLLYERYRTAMEAVKVQADLEKVRVDSYKAEVDAFDARWRAHAAEWQGFSAAVDGEKQKVEIYRAMLDGEMKRVDAWSSAQNVKIEAKKLEFGHAGLKADLWKASLQGYLAQIQGESARVSAQASIVDAQAKIYGADAQVEIAASAAADRTLQVGLQAASTQAEVQLKNADILIQRARNMVDSLISIRQTVAQVAGQLAASTMSAVNYSAGVNSSLNTSQGCTTSFNYSGEVADA